MDPFWTTRRTSATSCKIQQPLLRRRPPQKHSSSIPMRHISVLVSLCCVPSLKAFRTCMTTGLDLLSAGRVKKLRLPWPHGSLTNTTSNSTIAGRLAKSNSQEITTHGKPPYIEHGKTSGSRVLRYWFMWYSLHLPTLVLKLRLMFFWSRTHKTHCPPAWSLSST